MSSVENLKIPGLKACERNPALSSSTQHSIPVLGWFARPLSLLPHLANKEIDPGITQTLNLPLLASSRSPTLRTGAAEEERWRGEAEVGTEPTRPDPANLAQARSDRSPCSDLRVRSQAAARRQR
jgi:hypothetical protein